jgi:CheY-like chemotaxis protein
MMQAETGKKASIKNKDSLEMTQGAALSILVIEDDAAFAELTRAMVHQYSGIHTDWAGDGDSALTLLLKNHYDYVIVDQMLPAHTGLQLIKKADELIEEFSTDDIKAGRLVAPTQVLLMSGAVVEIPDGYTLKNFVMQDVFHKSSLNNGLARNLAI